MAEAAGWPARKGVGGAFGESGGLEVIKKGCGGKGAVAPDPPERPCAPMGFAGRKHQPATRPEGAVKLGEGMLGGRAMLDHMGTEDHVETGRADRIECLGFECCPRAVLERLAGLFEHLGRRVNEVERMERSVTAHIGGRQGARATANIGDPRAGGRGRKGGDKGIIGRVVPKPGNGVTPPGRGAIIAEKKALVHGAIMAQPARPRFRQSAMFALQTDNHTPLASGGEQG